MKRIILGILILTMTLGINLKSYAADRDLMGAQAVVACKAEIRKRLNYPSSAKFPWAITNYSVNGNIVKVNDTFDAQNAYGVYKKYGYSCTVQLTGENETKYTYILKNLSMW